MNKNHISYSQIRLYNNCKFAYDLSYNKGVQTIPSSPLKKGKTIHKLIEVYQQRCINKNAKSNIAHSHLLKKSFRADQKFFMDGEEDYHYLNEEEIQDVFDMFDRFVDNFSLDHNYMKQIEVERKVGLDSKLNIVDWENENLIFKGVIDLVYVSGNHTVIITDYKSDRFIESESVLKENLQLKIYAYIMSIVYPHIKQFKVRYYYVRYNKYHEHEISWADLEQVGFYLKQNHKMIKNPEQEFYPTLNKYCDWCGFKDQCPVMIKAKKLKILDKDSGVKSDKLAEELYALELLVKNRKALLKDRVKETQEFINVGDLSLGFHNKTTKKINVRDSVEYLHEKGFQDYEIYDQMSLSNQGINKIIGKDNKEFYQEMVDKELIKETSKSTFGFEKNGKD